MTFTGTESCGNSPKNLFVARFEEHLFNGDREGLSEAVAEECVLQIVRTGEVETLTGRDEVVAALIGLAEHGPDVGHLEAAITHGKAAAAWGHWGDAESDETLRHFSHTMWFETHKAHALAQIRVLQI